MLKKGVRIHFAGDKLSIHGREYTVRNQTKPGACMDCHFIKNYNCHITKVYGDTVMTDVCRQGFIFSK